MYIWRKVKTPRTSLNVVERKCFGAVTALGKNSICRSFSGHGLHSPQIIYRSTEWEGPFCFPRNKTRQIQQDKFSPGENVNHNMLPAVWSLSREVKPLCNQCSVPKGRGFSYQVFEENPQTMKELKIKTFETRILGSISNINMQKLNKEAECSWLPRFCT